MDKREQLEQAYHKLLGHLHTVWGKTRTEVEPKLKYFMAEAKEKAVAAGDVSKDEAEIIGRYIYRDVHAAGEFLRQTGGELKDWLAFDLQFAEQKVWDALKSIADKTQLDQQDFDHELQHGPEYKVGEVMGLGSLQCEGCGQIVHFHKPGCIDACAACGGEIFLRVSEGDD